MPSRSHLLHLPVECVPLGSGGGSSYPIAPRNGAARFLPGVAGVAGGDECQRTGWPLGTIRAPPGGENGSTGGRGRGQHGSAGPTAGSVNVRGLSVSAVACAAYRGGDD